MATTWYLQSLTVSPPLQPHLHDQPKSVIPTTGRRNMPLSPLYIMLSLAWPGLHRTSCSIAGFSASPAALILSRCLKNLLSVLPHTFGQGCGGCASRPLAKSNGQYMWPT